jgi:polyhydroxybutyrate depolymerase
MEFRPLLLSVGFAAAMFAAPCFAVDNNSILVNGQKRTYVLSRPSGSGPRPTIVMLHGTGMDAVAFAASNHLATIGLRDSFVTVYPETMDDEWWNALPAGYVPESLPFGRRPRLGTANDVDFITALVADLVRRGISDPKRIYLSGMSYGGLMALRIACVAPDKFAAVGVIFSSMPDPTGQDCRAPKPLPLVIMNGTADPVMPYEGGPTPAGFSVWSTERTLAFFRKRDGCSDTTEESKLPHRGGQTHVVLMRWSQCARGPVVLYQIVGGGHRVSGSLNGDFMAFEALWAFFRTEVSDDW